MPTLHLIAQNRKRPNPEAIALTGCWYETRGRQREQGRDPQKRFQPCSLAEFRFSGECRHFRPLHTETVEIDVIRVITGAGVHENVRGQGGYNSVLLVLFGVAVPLGIDRVMTNYKR